MRDNEGSGFFEIECLGEGTENKHLRDWVIITEDVLKFSVFNTICEKIRTIQKEKMVLSICS